MWDVPPRVVDGAEAMVAMRSVPVERERCRPGGVRSRGEEETASSSEREYEVSKERGRDGEMEKERE